MKQIGIFRLMLGLVWPVVLGGLAACGGGGQVLPVAFYATEVATGVGAAAQSPADLPASTLPAPTPPASTPPASTPPASTLPASTLPASTLLASTLPASTLPASTPTAAPGTDSFDLSALPARMVELINRDRAAAGLGPVAWDETAAGVARAHAEDMNARSFFSHWNPDGLGPDHRYTAGGGTFAARENLYTFSLTFEDGRGAPIDDWQAAIDQAEAQLMNSPGHRANILDPAHTHVGVGLAYDAATGQFRLAQEFVGRHATLSEPLPNEALPGAAVRVAGQFGPDVVGNGILDLAYEPFPAPLSAAELAGRSTYITAAQSLGIGRAVGPAFDETMALGSRPGYYHLRLFADLAGGQTLIVNHVITVR